MGLKELVVLGVMGLSTAAYGQTRPPCPTHCEFPQLMTCTEGSKEIRPRLKRHGKGNAAVDTYFIKVANSDEENFVEHITYIPEGEVVAATRFQRLGRTGTGSRIRLYLDFKPYGSLDEVYMIEQNVASGLKFVLKTVPEMIAERKGDVMSHMKHVLHEYRDMHPTRTEQYLYGKMIAAAKTRVCTTPTPMHTLP
jgi:hypothetical protein